MCVFFFFKDLLWLFASFHYVLHIIRIITGTIHLMCDSLSTQIHTHLTSTEKKSGRWDKRLECIYFFVALCATNQHTNWLLTKDKRPYQKKKKKTYTKVRARAHVIRTWQNAYIETDAIFRFMCIFLFRTLNIFFLFCVWWRFGVCVFVNKNSLQFISPSQSLALPIVVHRWYCFCCCKCKRFSFIPNN